MTATLTSLPSHAWTPPPLSWITHSSNSAGLIAIRACSLSCLQLLQHDAAVSAAVVWFGFCASYSRSTVTHASTLPIQWLPKVFQKHCKMQKKKSDACHREQKHIIIQIFIPPINHQSADIDCWVSMEAKLLQMCFTGSEETSDREQLFKPWLFLT